MRFQQLGEHAVCIRIEETCFEAKRRGGRRSDAIVTDMGIFEKARQ
jgi:hypothetical protein